MLKEVYANIRAVGVERATQATDLRQKTNPPVAEGCVAFSQRQLDAGFTTVEISRVAATIPHRLLYSGLHLSEEAACLRARYSTATVRERILRSSANRCSSEHDKE